jgi:hypothetical protein
MSVELPTPIVLRPNIRDKHHNISNQGVSRTISSASSVWSEEEDSIRKVPLPPKGACGAADDVELCASHAFDIFRRSTNAGAAQLFPVLKLAVGAHACAHDHIYPHVPRLWFRY